MSLLDTRFPELDLFLQRWQRRLNTRFLSGEGLNAIVVAAPLALVASLVLASLPPQRWLLWVATAATIAVLWMLVRLRRKLTVEQAALWLDEAGKTKGLFRAAAECLERKDLGPSGLRVLAEADRQRHFLSGPTAPKLPFRRLALRAGLAVVLTAASLTLLGSMGPRFGFNRSLADAAEPSASSPDPRAEMTPQNERELSPAEAAQRLFPEDSRLAALAEQALASGDPAALEALLEQNADAANPAARSSLGAGEASPGQNSESQEGSQAGSGEGQSQGRKPSASSESSSGKASQGDSDPSQDSGSGANPNAPSKQGQKDQSSARGQALGGASEGRENSKGSGSPGSQTGSGLGSGGAPGQGHSEMPLGQTRPSGSAPTLTLKEPSTQGLFEYVLPGSDAKLPEGQVLANARRSAEAVLSRTSPPLEFENTIRDYFLSLSSPSRSKEAAP